MRPRPAPEASARPRRHCDRLHPVAAGIAAQSQRNRVQEVTEITTGLKALAKELNVPVVALSQLSRQVENRDDKHPQLSDLRESGSIEQDADVVLFVFREEYYLSNKEPRPGTEEHIKWQTEMALVHGKAEVIIGKQRHGPTGTVQLQFDAAVTRFGDLSPEIICRSGSATSADRLIEALAPGALPLSLGRGEESLLDERIQIDAIRF